MLPVDDIGIAIADVYAKALMKLAAGADGEEAALEELADLVTYVNANAGFESFLTSVTVDIGARRQTLEKALRGKASDLLVNFLQILNTKERMPLLEQIHVQYRLAFEAKRGQVEVTATSATPLSGGVREALLGALRRYTGRDPILTEEVDASLIGGLVVHVGDEKIDFSVSRRLQGYRGVFLARASREIHSGREYFQGA